MPGQRKLFIAHASELAHRCVRAVQSNGLVANFVRSYAERYNRPGLSINPERSRELDSTIGREALLVVAAKVSRMLPAAFGRVKASSRGERAGQRNQNIPYLGPQEAAVAQAFYAEFLASLGRSLEWSRSEAASEAAAFGRDLEMYQRWSGRSESQIATQLNPRFDLRFAERINQQFSPGANPQWESSGRQHPAAPNSEDPGPRALPTESPFADRCALLLDPSMMEQARRAAAEFEIELCRATARMFSQLGSHVRHRKRPARKPIPLRRPAKSRNSLQRGHTKPRKAHHILKRKPAPPNRRNKPARVHKQKSRSRSRHKRKP